MMRMRSYVKSLVYGDELVLIYALEEHVQRIVADTRKVVENLANRRDFIRASRGCYSTRQFFSEHNGKPLSLL